MALGFLIYIIDTVITPKNQLNEIISWIFIVASGPLLFSYCYQFFDFENIVTQNKAYLEIDEIGFSINQQRKVMHGDIRELVIKIDAYYTERINVIYRTPEEQKSLGVKNFISIRTEKEDFSFYFKLNNGSHKERLEEILFTLIIQNKLLNLDSKKSIKLIPSRFKDSEDYKRYVLEQIIKKKINCTEGLLLHGYKTDKEAKYLREKYCV